MIIETKRLILRKVRADDFSSLLEMGQDPRVMEFLGPKQTPNDVKNFIDKIHTHDQQHGFSYLAITSKNDLRFIGLAGLLVPSYETPFTPCVEIAWRLKSCEWSCGYAFESAAALLQWGFQTHKLPEIVAFTAQINHRSKKLMQRLGMQSDPKENFHHPKLSPTDPLSLHVLYRLKMKP